MNYFQDVAPDGVTVVHERILPVHNPRQEITLRTPSGQIFMSGIVTMEPQTRDLDIYAANKGEPKWRAGYFVPDGRCWRFFTATNMLGVFLAYGEDGWDPVGAMDPVRHASETVRLLQNQYDSLGYPGEIIAGGLRS